MPYSYDNPPATVKNLPVGAQHIFIDVFNAEYEKSHDETKARMAAWGAVKNKYEKKGEEWVKKAKELQDATVEQPADKQPELQLSKVLLDRFSRLNDVEVYAVNGEYVRTVMAKDDTDGMEHPFADFTEGGHHWVYPAIPEDEVWVDKENAQEVGYIALHELHERNRMMHDEWTYEKAHYEANQCEQEARQNPDKLDDMIQAELDTTCDNGNSEENNSGEGMSGRDMADIATLAQAYAWHNKIHADYVDARWGRRSKEKMQSDHEAIVRKIRELSGKHLPKGEALDDTLPNDLQGAVKLRGVSFIEELPPHDAAEGTKMSQIQVLRTGTFHHPRYGKFAITQDTLDRMLANFTDHRPKAPTEMVVDYEHMSAAEPAVVAPAAGWVKALKVVKDALYATVEWTKEAAKKIGDKEYRFISPEFTLTYKDKESGKDIGPTLLSVALVNRPFLEGMAPVVLSREVQEALAFSETGTCQDCPSKEALNVIIALAEWTKAYINELPDSSFAYIEPGGEKDEGGKTKPRGLRHLPYKDKDGKVDLPHLRNALARLPQSSLSAEAKKSATAKLEAAAKREGVGDYSDKEDIDMKPEELQALQDKAAKADLLEKQLGDATKARETAEAAIKAKEAGDAVEGAVKARKILPKQKDWALAYYLKDKAGFEQFVKDAELVGPPPGETKPGEKIAGKEQLGNDGEGAVELSEAETKIAEGMAKALNMPLDKYLKNLRESKAKVLAGK
jgi:cation transport regulator ChaB